MLMATHVVTVRMVAPSAALCRLSCRSSHCYHLPTRPISSAAVLRTSRAMSQLRTRSMRAASQRVVVPSRRLRAVSSHSAVLRYSSRANASETMIALPPDYVIYKDDVHCFLGPNGSGKTQFLTKLQLHVKTQQARGEIAPSWRLANLSLDAHREFVAEHGRRVVADVLGGIGSPRARDLIVRLGLFPVWEQQVRHLSTGEMRKLLLAVSLLETPRASVLILDQPFDGLDVKARRQLRWMLRELTRGFTRLLVETTGAKHEAFAYKTQVLVVANRLDQVFPEIFTHAVLMKQDGDTPFEMLAWPGARNDDVRNNAMMKRLEAFYRDEYEKRAKMTDTELFSLVEQLFECKKDAVSGHMQALAVQLRGVSISYSRKKVLLEDVNFERQVHEHWALLGPNGSGKSSLMRVLMQTPGHGLIGGSVMVVGEQVHVSGSRCSSTESFADSRPTVEAISTDQHIQLLHKSLQSGQEEAQSALSLIEHNAASPEAVELVVRMLLLPDAVKTRTLSRLSQGEQKLVLIARALVARPPLLILDEVTHGLDPFNRAHVLRVIDAIGQHAAWKTHLVLITHHEEEITPCFTRVYEIHDKQLVERSTV